MPEQMPGDVSMQPGGPAMPPPQPQPQIQQPPPQRDTMPAADMPDQDGQDGLEQERQPWPDLPRGEEPYIRRNGQRHHSEWGQPDFIMRGAQNYPGVAPGPWMPQISDVNRLVWEATQGLMQNGSVPVAKLAGLMGNARGNYTKEYLAGRKAMMELQHEQYAMAQDQLVRQQNQELREYAEIFANHADNPSEMTEELTNLANKFNDHRLLTELNSKGLAAAEKLLAVRDNLSAEMGAVRQQRDKHSEAMARVALDNEKVRAAKRSEEEAAAFGVKTDDTTSPDATSPTDDDSLTPEAAPDDSDAEKPPAETEGAPAAEAPEAAPGRPGAPPAAKAEPATPAPARSGTPATAPATGGAAPTGSEDAFPATPQGDQPVTRGRAMPLAQQPPAPARNRSQLDVASDQLLRAGPDQTNMIPNKEIRFGIVNDSWKKLKKLDEVVQDPNLKTEKQIYDAVAKISPGLADDFQGHLHYKVGPSTAGLGGGSRQTEYWNNLARLAAKADPTWSRGRFKAVQDFREAPQKPNHPLNRIPTAVSAAKEALQVLDVIQRRHPNVGAYSSPEDLEAALGKDPMWARFKLMWQRYNQDVTVIAQGGTSVTETEAAVHAIPQIPYFGSIASYRSAIAGDMDQVASKTRTFHRLWNSFHIPDEPMPGYDPDAEADMEHIGKMDPMTGSGPDSTVQTPFSWDK